MSAPENPSGGNAPQSFSFQKALLISRPSGLIHPNLLHLELETAQIKNRATELTTQENAQLRGTEHHRFILYFIKPVDVAMD